MMPSLILVDKYECQLCQIIVLAVCTFFGTQMIISPPLWSLLQARNGCSSSQAFKFTWYDGYIYIYIYFYGFELTFCSARLLAESQKRVK